tara:strand:+ start:18703 stop:19218 length:516 start_codon:yes stop_codon:yes gene_type:complete
MDLYNRYVHIITFTCASIFGFTLSAHAETATDSFDVSITITSTCSIDAATDGDIAFGNQLSSVTNIQLSTASIDVVCTLGTPYTLALNNGLNADATSRRMIGQTVNTEFVPYELYSDAFTTLWGDGTLLGALKLGLIGTGLTQSHTIFAQVPSTNASAQDYSDTVTATITW